MVISILFIVYIILHPPFRLLTVRSLHKEKDKFVLMTKIPFRTYPLFRFNSYYDGCNVWINGCIIEENKDMEITIK